MKNQNRFFSKILSFSAILLFLIFGSQIGEAQSRSAGDVGIGFQAGQPTGLTIRIYKPNGWSPDFLAAWDLNDFFFLNLHGVRENHLGSSGTAHFFYGPGAFVGIDDRPKELEDEVRAGVSGTFGFSFLFDKLELFVQGTPRLELIDSTNFDVGGGIGLRFYL